MVPSNNHNYAELFVSNVMWHHIIYYHFWGDQRSTRDGNVDWWKTIDIVMIIWKRGLAFRNCFTKSRLMLLDFLAEM